jgi:acyl dehydratase
MAEKPLAEREALVGTSKGVVEGFEIEAGKVAEFARAIGATDDVYFDETVAKERGHRAIPAPLTFVTTSHFPRYRTTTEGTLGFDLGFDDRHLVHGEQEYDVTRPMYVGDVLTGEATLTDVFQRDGDSGGTLNFAVVETAYADDADDHVLTEQTTVIETTDAMGGGA